MEKDSEKILEEHLSDLENTCFRSGFSFAITFLCDKWKDIDKNFPNTPENLADNFANGYYFATKTLVDGENNWSKIAPNLTDYE